MEPNEVGELLKVILDVYARQMAMQDLLRQLDVTRDQMDEAVSKAKERLSKVPRIAYLSSRRPQDLQGLSALLESIQWPD